MESLIEKLPGVKENILLSTQTTFKIGGPAKYFFKVKNEKDLIKAIKTARFFNLPFFLLGEGSNLLVSDNGYSGLVIKIKNQELKVKKIDILAEAGVSLKSVINFSVKESLTGMEWAEGIPGTVGAAVYGNVGAFGSTIAGNTKAVKVLDTKNLDIKNFTVKDCHFNNKESIFKQNKNLIILSVLLKLKKGDIREIQKEVKRFSEYRKLNHPLNLPSAGCIFKNYNKKIEDPKLLKKFPELIEFNKGSRIPTSYLIDKSGLKGKIIGKVQVSEKHANFIVNLGGAESKDVIKLISIIKSKVNKKFNIKLEEEIQYLGF